MSFVIDLLGRFDSAEKVVGVVHIETFGLGLCFQSEI